MPLARKPFKILSKYKAITCAFACLALSVQPVNANNSKTAVLERTLASSGEGWRLPTRKELRELIEVQSEPPMINPKHFPATHAGSYWTADNNQLLANGHWVVNFYTGHSYGRAPKTQSFAIRLVKDR